MMQQEKTPVQVLHEEFTKFNMTMWELQLIKQVATDLRSYRRMIQVKKYD